MRPPRPFLNVRVLVATAIYWGLITSSATAQTVDGALNNDGMQAATRLAHQLEREIDLRSFPNKVDTLKEALIALYQMVSNQGVDLPIIVDIDSFKDLGRAHSDVYQAMVRLPSDRRYMTIAAILQSFVDQATRGKGTWLIRPDFVEITCVARERRQHGKAILLETVDLDGAPRFMAFGVVIDCLANQMRSKGRPLDLDVDVAALQKAVSPRFDLAKLKVRLPHADPDLTIGKFLRYIVDQIPGSNAEILGLQDAIHITTVSRAIVLRPLLPRLRANYRDIPQAKKKDAV
jgi:hypothetical protein